MRKSLFLLDTGNYCLLCLRRPSTTTTNTSQSFPDVSEYFKMSMSGGYSRKTSSATASASSDNNTLPIPLLHMYDMKGTMCRDCAPLSANFTQLLQKLKDVERELNSCLKSIYHSMLGGGIHSSWDVLQKFKVDMLGKPETALYYGLVERLRRETMEQSTLLIDHHLNGSVLGGQEPERNEGHHVGSNNIGGGNSNHKQLPPQHPNLSGATAMPIRQPSAFNPKIPSSLPHDKLISQTVVLANSNLRNKYQCNLCAAKFCNRARCEDHIDTVHHGNKFCCGICGRSNFSSRYVRNRHEKECLLRKLPGHSTIQNSINSPNLSDYPNLPDSIGSGSHCHGLPVTVTPEPPPTFAVMPREIEPEASVTKPKPRLMKCTICRLIISDLPTHMYYAHSKKVGPEVEVHNNNNMEWNKPATLNLQEKCDSINLQPETAPTMVMVDREKVVDNNYSITGTLSSTGDLCKGHHGAVVTNEQQYILPGFGTQAVFQDPDIDIGEVKAVVTSANRLHYF